MSELFDGKKVILKASTLLLLLICSLPIFCFGQDAPQLPEKIIIRGIVMDDSTRAPIPFAQIVLQGKVRGTTTNESGAFAVKIHPSDTLIFSSMGYAYSSYCFKDSSQLDMPNLIFLKETAIRLKNVDVYGIDENHPLIKKELKPYYIPGLGQNADGTYPEPKDLTGFQKGMRAVGSPISALYDAFSKEGKQRRKMVEILRNENEEARQIAYYQRRLSPERISRLLNISKEEAVNFLKFYTPSMEFVLYADRNQLTLDIMEFYERYQLIKDL
ncbi:carboxypeptidase-like regulatory domain-containing protein [Persicobacter psychrovividus]|uniref:Carboxypeptidase-like regulatory domain-containing protein n=1 Tax=Persicobacter psychrovividus TaxID=387638 RepID=A0ABM7VFG2_9BACT|nr:hypothetical protein PEPS_20050 [Persicobacter psychrovividus]